MKLKTSRIIFAALALLLSSCSGENPSSSPSQSTGETTSQSASESSSTITSDASTSESSASTSTSDSTASSQSQSESSASTSESTASSQASSESGSDSSSSDWTSSSGYDGYDWNVDLTKFGLDFQTELGSLMNATRTKTATYKECLSIGAKAAAYPNANSSTFIPFYHDAKESEKTVTSSCNREHTWPNSRGGGNIETDPIVIRPTITKDNSNRGNNFYGNSLSNEWDPASCGYEGARGESARVILYAVTCYHVKYNLNLSNNPSDSTGAKTMGTLKTLLEWNRTYKPTEFEKTVNERYATMGHARNAFVDHPEYADYIYDDDGYRASSPGPQDSDSSASSSQTVKTYYQQFTDLSRLDGSVVSIISPTSSAGTSYVSMTSNQKSETLPWYLVGNTMTRSDDHFYATIPPEGFQFDMLQDGTYEITASSGKQLYGYVAGTHYSIAIAEDEAEVRASQGSTEVSAISNKWTISDLGNGDVSMMSGASVYLEYYNSSWCGYRSAPSLHLMLLDPNPLTEVL